MTQDQSTEEPTMPAAQPIRARCRTVLEEQARGLSRLLLSLSLLAAQQQASERPPPPSAAQAGEIRVQ